MSRLFWVFLVLAATNCGFCKEVFIVDGEPVQLIEVGTKGPTSSSTTTTNATTAQRLLSQGPLKAESATFPVTITPRVNFDPSVLKKGYRKKSVGFSTSSSTVQSYLTSGLLLLVVATACYLLMGQKRSRD